MTQDEILVLMTLKNNQLQQAVQTQRESVSALKKMLKELETHQESVEPLIQSI